MIRARHSLPIALTIVTVALLFVGKGQHPLGGGGCVPLPTVIPAINICHALNGPALLIARIVEVALLKLRVSISFDYIFVAVVFLFWYLLGRSIELGYRAERRTWLRLSGKLMLVAFMALFANFAYYDWKWGHNVSKPIALAEVACDLLWATGMLWLATRDIRREPASVSNQT